MEKTSLCLPIENHRRENLRVVFEPWADEILLAPGESCVVHIQGPPGICSITEGDDYVAIWAWENCLGWITKENEVICDLRQGPRVPEGLLAMKTLFQRMTPPYV